MSKGSPLVVLAVVCLAPAGLAQTSAQTQPSLRFGGDFRARYEHTARGNGVPALGREVVRFRLGATYAPQPDLTVRARIATGDPDDPNSTDVTLGSFVNDLPFSLDLASIELSRPKWGVFAGKFTNPFLTTELVWDGDVNPQGAGGRLNLGKSSGSTATLTGMYFIVDQQAGDTMSDMGGAQIAVNSGARGSWRFTGAVGYYDYHIRSLVNASVSGDVRGNRLAPGNTAYLSDFNLFDAVLMVDYTGFGKSLPLRFVGDYVHNGGANDLNTGFWVDLFLGSTQRTGDVRGRYGYAQVETDAVLAAFAHDNTTLGTNSETHTLSLDLVPRANTLLTATAYIYAPLEPPGVFQTRVRLNAMVTF
ncbi:MAG TPA: putative porin [Gemmatimonadales bacterium]|nr:putative porin [Gemmatimonadales bacterium]